MLGELVNYEQYCEIPDFFGEVGYLNSLVNYLNPLVNIYEGGLGSSQRVGSDRVR
jgi:hypothetical protein